MSFGAEKLNDNFNTPMGAIMTGVNAQLYVKLHGLVKLGGSGLADQLIAETKMPDLNAASLESAMSMIAGTARSMGVVVGE